MLITNLVVTGIVNHNSVQRNKDQELGTGFIGRIKFKDDKNESTVLVTCYHVIIGGMPVCYEDKESLDDDEIRKIEKHAKDFKIIIKNEKDKTKEICLREILVEGSYKVSPRLSVCL